MRQLFGVVNHAVQLPLHVHLGLRSQRKTAQALVVSEITEHRLDDGDAPCVELTAPIAVDRLLPMLSASLDSHASRFGISLNLDLLIIDRNAIYFLYVCLMKVSNCHLELKAINHGVITCLR